MKTDALFELLGKVDDDLISAAHDPMLLRKDKKPMKTGNRIKAVLIAAALIAVLALSAGAAYRFFMPKGLEDVMSFTSENMLQIIDEGEADANTLKVTDKSIDTAGFHVTFEGIVRGKALRNNVAVNLSPGARNTEQFSVDKTYAIFTITRNAGGAVLYNPDYKDDVNAASIGYLVQVKDYVPNPNCFPNEYYFYEDPDTNVFYLACDITSALPFGGKEMKIAVIGHFVGNMEIVDMDENGYMCSKEGYTGISAIFDLPVDASFADETAVAAFMANGTFNTREEYESLMAEFYQNEDNAAPVVDAAEATTVEDSVITMQEAIESMLDAQGYTLPDAEDAGE